MAREIKHKADYDEAINGDRPVVILFTASWTFSPEYEKLSGTSDSLLCKVDVDNSDAADICQKHDVSCMPTLVHIKGKTQVDKMEGVNKGKLAEWGVK